MGEFIISVDDFEQDLREFLENQEGTILGSTMVAAWNRISRKEGWHNEIRMA